MGKRSAKLSVEEDSRDKGTKKNISKESTLSVQLKALSEEIVSKSEDQSHGKWVDLDDDRPYPRAHSSMTLINDGYVVMFGGEFFDGFKVKLYNETLLYNLSTYQWKRLETPSSPIPRCSHQAAFYNNRIYIFGGEFNNLDEFHHFNDMNFLCLSTLRWKSLKPLTPSPSPRSGHRMVLWKNFWVLFGGFHDNGKESTYFNDLYYYDLDTNRWYEVNQKLFSNSLPEPRSGCLLVPLNDDKHLLMHGGFTKTDTSKNVSGTNFTDVWLIDMNLVLSNSHNVLVWSRVKTSMNPEFTTGLSYATSGDFAIVFGGVKDVDQGLNVKSTFSNQSLKLNLNQRKYNPIELNIKDKDVNEEELDEFNQFSISKTAPTPRMNSNVVVWGDKFYVFGGIVEIKNVEITLSDCWVLNLKSIEWKCVDQGFQNEKLYKSQMEEESEDDEGEGMGDDSDEEIEESEYYTEDSEDLK